MVDQSTQNSGTLYSPEIRRALVQVQRFCDVKRVFDLSDPLPFLHMPKALFLLNILLQIPVPPPCLFSIMLAYFSHSELDATFLMHVVIFIHILFASPPCKGPSFRTPYFVRWLFFKLPPLHPCHFDVLTQLNANLKEKIRYHKLMLRHHSWGITLQSKQACLSSLLARMKSIWLQCLPLLKVTRWTTLFLKKIHDAYGILVYICTH
jgi:hypothetical protein